MFEYFDDFDIDNDFNEYEFFKELYYHELDLKEVLSAKVNYAFAINSLLITGYVYVYNRYQEMYSRPILLLVISIILFLSSFFCIIRSIYGYAYTYVPPAKEIYNYTPSFERYYRKNSKYFKYHEVSKKSVINYCMKTNISRIYRESASNNRSKNLIKSRWMKHYSWSLVLLTVILFINMIIVFCNDFI